MADLFDAAAERAAMTSGRNVNQVRDELVRGENLYARDGLCHNANRGTYGHECGKPATWIGTKPNGFRSGFCDEHKERGDEAVAFVRWERRK